MGIVVLNGNVLIYEGKNWLVYDINDCLLIFSDDIICYWEDFNMNFLIFNILIFKSDKWFELDVNSILLIFEDEKWLEKEVLYSKDNYFILNVMILDDSMLIFKDKGWYDVI